MSATALSPLPFDTVLGTRLTLTSYEQLSGYLFERSREPGVIAVDFTNTHIVTMRRTEPRFREMTEAMDLFIPDGMPLIWCLNAQGAGLTDRVYGPTFLRECVTRSPAEVRHYFLGGNQACLDALLANARKFNPALTIAGARNGYFRPEEEAAIVEEIKACSPDLVWIGLGTPKQQEWVARWKSHFSAGALLAVGFAFDVNAGTKKDAPAWMQRLGMTWIFRIASEPRRLLKRYLVNNSQFVRLLLQDLWQKANGQTPRD